MTKHLLSTVCIVGDRFEAFATHPAVRTVSRFVTEVQRGCFDDLRGPLSISWGQGVTGYDRQFVCDGLRARGLLDSVLLAAEEPPLVNRSRCHKRRESNGVLAGLRRTGEASYRASLRLHPENEFLLDHQSTEHLHGMMVIEAFRQMSISFCEEFVAIRWPERAYTYVWNGMDLRFENFLFPVHAEIDCLVREADVTDPRRLRFSVDMEIRQGRWSCASAHVEFAAYDKNKFACNEHRMAGRTLDAVLAGAMPVEATRLLEVG